MHRPAYRSTLKRLRIACGAGAGLSEIALMNRDGNYHTTKTADIGAAGTLALAQSPSIIPADPSADFSSVNLYDLPGPTT